MLRLASENGAVLRKPPPVALLTGFNNGLNFQLLAWTHRSDTWPETASALRAAINQALGDAGIAFPHNDVRLVSVDQGIPALLRHDGEPEPPIHPAAPGSPETQKSTRGTGPGA